MKIFKNKYFHRWAKFEGLTDDSLREAIHEMNKGLFDANLGSGLFKKRLAKKGRGKSGGYRTLIAFKNQHKAVFIYGFAKNQRENIGPRELETYKKIVKHILEIADHEVAVLIRNNELIEVKP